MSTQTDWSAWSRESVRMMQERNDTLIRDFGLEGSAYHWDLAEARLVFPAAGVVFDLSVIGSVSESTGTFLWGWANDSLPEGSLAGIERVREFGEANDLGLLARAEWRGGLAEGLEMAAIAGRLLDAAAVWVAPTGDVTLFFALRFPGRGA